MEIKQTIMVSNFKLFVNLIITDFLRFKNVYFLILNYNRNDCKDSIILNSGSKTLH